MPEQFTPARLWRRAVPVVAALAVLVLAAVLAPGLSEVRERLANASLGWTVAAVLLEALSCVSYVLMFRPVFCSLSTWRSNWELGLSELAMGSLVPASGAGGLALGAWVLRRGGMSAARIARRSVAFFIIKSSVNFVAVALIGGLWAFGVFGPPRSELLTALPAALSVVTIGAVLVLAHFGHGEEPAEPGSVRGWAAKAGRSVVSGVAEAVALVRTGNVLIIGGAFGYWAFDNAVLWATFHAVGNAPPLSVILLGYLIGQLGGLLPLPGGIGGIDGGLIGTLIVYGADPASTAGAVLAYRLILFWLPLLLGGPAFLSLWRRIHREA